MNSREGAGRDRLSLQSESAALSLVASIGLFIVWFIYLLSVVWFMPSFGIDLQCDIQFSFAGCLQINIVALDINIVDIAAMDENKNPGVGHCFFLSTSATFYFCGVNEFWN